LKEAVRDKRSDGGIKMGLEILLHLAEFSVTDKSSDNQYTRSHSLQKWKMSFLRHFAFVCARGCVIVIEKNNNRLRGQTSSHILQPNNIDARYGG